MAKRIKIGQIGIGHNHAASKMEAVQHFPELFEVIGYSEDNEEWIKKRGGCDQYKNLSRLSKEEIIEKADAILVETDVWDLTKTAQLCVDAGKHIHMDKPASGTLAEYKKLLDDSKRKNLVVQLGYMYRYNSAIMKAVELAKSGALGEIYSINAEMSTYHCLEYKKWLTNFDGGIMYILGSHLVDLIVYMMGEPDNVVSFLKHTGLDGVDFPDNNQAILEYGNSLARINVSSVEMNGWGRRQLVVCGSKGTVEIKPIENVTFMTYASPEISLKPYEDQKEIIDVRDIPKNERYDVMMQDFYEYIMGTKSNPYTYEHEYSVQKVLLDIIEKGKR